MELRVLGSSSESEIDSSVAIELEGEVFAPEHDLRGSITGLVDLKDNLFKESYRFSAFGEEQIFDQDGHKSGESLLGNPWRYAAKRIDEETGLVYFGRRYYNPDLGRWISQDPAAYVDGPNLYAYVHNNPLKYYDLYGLWSVRETFDSVREFFSHFSQARENLKSEAGKRPDRIDTSWQASNISKENNLPRSLREYISLERRAELEDRDLDEAIGCYCFDMSVELSMGAIVAGGLQKSFSFGRSLITPSTDEALGALVRGLTPAQQSRINTIDNIISYSAKPHDFKGVIKELQGIETGYDHVTEMKQSVRGLEKALRGIQGSLKNPNLDDAARSSLRSALKKGQETLDKMNKTLNGG